jgi:hypothetical protein
MALPPAPPAPGPGRSEATSGCPPQINWAEPPPSSIITASAPTLRSTAAASAWVEVSVLKINSVS